MWQVWVNPTPGWNLSFELCRMRNRRLVQSGKFVRRRERPLLSQGPSRPLKRTDFSPRTHRADPATPAPPPRLTCPTLAARQVSPSPDSQERDAILRSVSAVYHEPGGSRTLPGARPPPAPAPAARSRTLESALVGGRPLAGAE